MTKKYANYTRYCWICGNILLGSPHTIYATKMRKLFKLLVKLKDEISECDCSCGVDHALMRACLDIHKIYTDKDEEGEFVNFDDFHDFIEKVKRTQGDK